MKRFLLFTFCSRGQTNLVPNWSFEDTLHCPPSRTLLPGSQQIADAIGWYNPTQESPDYYNQCSSFSGGVGVPANSLGYQNARTGVAYAGIGTYSLISSNDREYIEIKLKDSLRKGRKYCVSFYVSLADSVSYSNNDIGAYFSTTLIVSGSTGILPYIPQIENPSTNQLTSKTVWMEVSGNFIANGGEQYVTIGNFENDTNPDTTYIQGGGYEGVLLYSYYYIDDVSVIECDDTIVTDILQIPNVITPNNDGKNDAFYIQKLPAQSSLTIFNRWGNTVYHSLNYQNNWEADGVNSGTYYYLLTLPDGTLKKGFIEVIK